MDIFSHGLWTAAIYKVANKKAKKSFNVLWAAFWGMFPDLFAFTIPFAWLFWNLIFGHANLNGFSHHGPSNSAQWISSLTPALYNISHSAVVFIFVFAVTFLILRKIKWELFGWLIHILLDVPVHSYKFYPTPVFWPISNWKFNGISWGMPEFLIPNYIAIIVVYLIFYYQYRKNKKT
jgi:hypothetical protein